MKEVTEDPYAPLRDRNRRLAMGVAFVVAAMVGLSFAAVPAYRAFCQVTGWGGTTARASAASEVVLKRKMTVQFDATTARDLPWRFRPEVISQTMQIGETGLAYYVAENTGDRPVIGTASFNVTPAKAGLFFRKIECFCFAEQRLEPGQKISMPVTYFIDPAIAEEKGMADVTTITLSYTFFRNPDAERRAGLHHDRKEKNGWAENEDVKG